MSIFKKAERRAVKVKLGVTGPSGSGKTYSALRLATGIAGGGRMAVIDTENGSASLYSDKFSFDVVDVEAPFTPEKYIAAIKAAVEGGYKVVVIDSFSHAWEQVLDKKTAMDARGGNSFTNWGVAGKDLKTILTEILQSDIHIVATMRSKTEYSQEKDDRGKTTIKKLGLAPIMREGIEYEFTTVFDVAMNHEAGTSKDRTGLFTDKFFQITEQTGVQVVNWLNSGKSPLPQTEPVKVETVEIAEEFVKPITTDQLAKLNLYNQNSVGAKVIEKALAHFGNPLDMLTADEAEKVIERCQEEMNKEPAKTPAPAQGAFPWPADIAAWLDENAAAFNAYLVSIKWIQPGQTFRHLSGDNAEKIVRNPAGAAKAAKINPFQKAA